MLRYAALGYLVGSAYLRLWAYEARPRPSAERAIGVLRSWCRGACRRLRIAVDVEGGADPGVALFVSNHRSYLDIPVLSSALPATFLAKADVAAMPLVGRVAQHTGAVFVDRDDVTDRMCAARALRRRLRATSVIAFPEGTTWAAPSVGPFADGPFRLARRAGIGVVPVTVRYSDRRAYWVEEVGVWEHLRQNVLRREPLRAVVHIGRRIDPADFPDAADFVRAVHRAVEAPIAACGELV